MLILFATFLSIGHADSTAIKEGNLFIYEYSAKIFGQAVIGFVVANDSNVVQDLGYKIYYDTQKIKKINRITKPEKLLYKYTKKSDGNIYIEKLKRMCYNDKNFNNNKRYSEQLYKLISTSFDNLTNKERFYIIEKLFK